MTAATPGGSIPDHENDSDVTVPQVSVVVRDLEEGMQLYADAFDWKVWTVLDFRDLKHNQSLVRGRPADYAIRVAITRAGGVDFELIEPLGPSPYQEFLDEHGPGLHHIQCVSPTRDVLEQLQAQGRPSLCSGEFGVLGAGVFGYTVYDETPDLPFIIGTYSGDASRLSDLPAKQVVVGSSGDDATADGFAGDDLIQVAAVVPDVEATLHALRQAVGWGPWRVYDFTQLELRDRRYRGQEMPFAMHIATVRAGNLHIELLSPTGPGPYRDFLDEHGPGLHHIQVRGSDAGRTRERLAIIGATPQFSGRVGIDTTSGLDFWLYEGGGLSHLVEVTDGDRAKLMDTVRYRSLSGD